MVITPKGLRESFKSRFKFRSSPTSPIGITTDVQPVNSIDIDPEKLMEKLQLEFPSGFEVHVGRLQVPQGYDSLTPAADDA
jgi:hypothetical protein